MDNIKDYLELLTQWMKYYELNPVTDKVNYEIDAIYSRSRAELSKMGAVDTYCIVKYVKEGATADFIKAYSKWAYDFAYNHRTGGPVGLFSMLVVYPLIIVDRVTPEQLSFINDYCPKHFAAAEFPSVLDLSTGSLYSYPKTPIWGYAYYGSYRNETFQIYSPDSWRKVTG